MVRSDRLGKFLSTGGLDGPRGDGGISLDGPPQNKHLLDIITRAGFGCSVKIAGDRRGNYFSSVVLPCSPLEMLHMEGFFATSDAPVASRADAGGKSSLSS